MTKIIDGIVYGSTKFGKSKLLVSSQNNYNERTDEVDTTDFNYFDEGLYVTEKGRFFVETRTYGGGWNLTHDEIVAMTKAEALVWAEEKGKDVSKLVEYLESIGEKLEEA
tara:strand:- start:642 stop:971 length:330 start_codon:yes stop_codon:yes gene_type:complete